MAEATGGVGFEHWVLSDRLGLRLLVGRRLLLLLLRHLAYPGGPLDWLDLRRLDLSIVVILTRMLHLLLPDRFEFGRG